MVIALVLNECLFSKHVFKFLDRSDDDQRLEMLYKKYKDYMAGRSSPLENETPAEVTSDEKENEDEAAKPEYEWNWAPEENDSEDEGF